MRKVISLFLCIVTVWAICGGIANADIATDVSQEMKTLMTNTYTQAKSIGKKDNFSNWCGFFVQCQLRALGIGFSGSSTIPDGAKVYSTLTDGATTSSGHIQRKFPGKDCLNNIVEKYGTDIRNIVISYPHATGDYDSDTSSSNPGHVIFIHRILNGNVYFLDNATWNGYKEGTPLVMSLERFVKANATYHWDAIGAVVFEDSKKVLTKTSADALNWLQSKVGADYRL